MVINDAPNIVIRRVQKSYTEKIASNYVLMDGTCTSRDMIYIYIKWIYKKRVGPESIKLL